MSSPERPQGEPQREQQQEPFFATAQFDRERAAFRAYATLQTLIFRADCDLSVYRFTLRGVSHVAVLGAPPPTELVTRLEKTLARGVPTTLPPEITQALWERRAEATKLGPWVEGHYRPGKRI